MAGSKKKTVTQICNYLEKNLERMRYDEYLREGYPIASGVIEGACRHLVKDRMERAGMHWTPPWRRRCWKLRSTFVSGQWDEYQSYRIELETQETLSVPGKRLSQQSVWPHSGRLVTP